MDVNTLLEKWYNAKKKVEKLEANIAKYKKAIDKRMESSKTNRIVGDNYSISKRNNSRTYITKDSVPASIWTQYSSRCTYQSYHLTKNR